MGANSPLADQSAPQRSVRKLGMSVVSPDQILKLGYAYREAKALLSAVELGVKFQSSVGGKITGIRFYKSPQNLGTHTAHLWTSTGTSLGTATFTGETVSGWQQANFATPVTVQANTVYVASYFAPQGCYSADANYFANPRVSGVLTALASAGAGGNGVYAYSAISKFPTSTFNGTNYWVDVVFMS